MHCRVDNKSYQIELNKYLFYRIAKKNTENTGRMPEGVKGVLQ